MQKGKKTGGQKYNINVYNTISVDFIAYVEEGTEDKCDWTPYMYFKQFVNDYMLQETAEQTNLYSVQEEGKSINTTVSTDVLCESMLGDENKTPVCDVMSQDQFLKLVTLIHFQDNLSVSDDAKKDKLCKLWP